MTVCGAAGKRISWNSSDVAPVIPTRSRCPGQLAVAAAASAAAARDEDGEDSLGNAAILTSGPGVEDRVRNGMHGSRIPGS